MALSPDGQIVLTGKYREARLWEVKSGWTLGHLQGLTDTVNCVAFSPDGSLAFTGSDDARLWEVKSGREMLRLEGHKNSIESVAFSPDGRLVLTGSYDGVRLWEVKSGSELLHLKDHTDDTLRVAFSPDGSFALACDIYGRIYFYRAQGSERGKLIGIYVAPYEVRAMYWQSAHQVTIADMGGPTWRPHFSDVTLEGVWEFE
jgi:WD40 repeat protein